MNHPETGPLLAPRKEAGSGGSAVDKSGLANSCRREAVILPSSGLGKPREGEERPSMRWPRGRERSIGLRLVTLGHEVRALLRGQCGVSFTTAGWEGWPIAGTRLRVCPAARRVPELGNKGAAQPLLPSTSVPARPGARSPEESARPGFPFAEFREVSPAARYVGRRGGTGGSQACVCSELRHRLFPFRASGESRRGPGTSPPGPWVARDFELLAPRGPSRPAAHVSSLQILDASGPREGSCLVPGDCKQPQAP